VNKKKRNCPVSGFEYKKPDPSCHVLQWGSIGVFATARDKKVTNEADESNIYVGRFATNKTRH